MADEWNPMAAAFADKNFNRYNEGVGRDLSGSVGYNQGDGIKLYVRNVPIPYGREGLFNLFAEYGRVLKCTLLKPSDRPDSTVAFGFVTMERIEDAQLAISKLNGKRLGQFTLTVSPALTDEEKQRRKKLKQQEDEFMGCLHSDRYRAAEEEERSNFQVKGQQMKTQSFAPSSTGFDLSRSDWHSLSKASTDSARMVPKLAISVGRGSLRHVQERGETIHLPKETLEALGRGRGGRSSSAGPLLHSYGQTPGHRGPYQAPGMYLTTAPRGFQSFTGNLQGDSGRGVFRPTYRLQGPGFSIVTPPRSDQAEGRKLCVFCCREGCVYLCARCKMHYCSSDCQKKDWPKHRDICMSIGEMINGGTDSYGDLSQKRPDHSERMNNAHDINYDTDIEGLKSRLNRGSQARKKDRSERSCDSDTNQNETEAKRNLRDQNKKNSDSRFTSEKGRKGKFQNARNLRGKRTGQEDDAADVDKAGLERNDDQGTRPLQSQVERPDSDSRTKCREHEEKQREGRNEKKNQKGSTSEKSKQPSSTEEDGASQSGHTDETDNVDAGIAGSGDALCSAMEITLPIKTSGKCYLTYYQSPWRFWISLEEYLQAYGEMYNLMQEQLSQSNLASPLKPEAGETYGVLYDGEWGRVKVVSIQGLDVKVFFIDYGNQSSVKVEDLRPLTIDMLKVPAQAVCCCISQLKPKGSESWTEDACKSVEQWLGPPMSRIMSFEIVAKKGSIHAVKISNDTEAMSEFLLAKGFAQRATDEPGLPDLTKTGSPSRVMARTVGSVMTRLQQGDRLSVILAYVHSAQRFAVFDSASLGTLAELSSFLQSEYSDRKQPYRPVLGELVVANFAEDNMWYRAEVVAVDTDTVSLFFMDFGNTEIQTLDTIQPATGTVVTATPSQAIVCGLFGVETVADISSDTLNKEFQAVLAAFFDVQGKGSLLVKAVAKDSLLVDLEAASGLLLSETLNRRLTEVHNNLHSHVACKQASSPTTTPSAHKVSPAVAKVSKGASPDIDMEKLAVGGGDSLSVQVSYVKNCAEFYLRLNSKNEQFIGMMKELNHSVDSSPPLTSPCIGSLTAVQFSADHIWYRGRIEGMKEQVCKVRFIDYGNCECTPVSGLRELASSLCSLPAQAIRCHLEGDPHSFPQHVHKEFKQLVEDVHGEVKVLGKDDMGFSVQMFVDGKNVLPMSAETEDVNEHPLTRAFKVPSIVLDKNVSIKVECVNMISPLEFYVQVSEHIASVVAATLRMKSRFEQSPDPVSSVSVGDFVAGRFSQDNDVIWYRVRVDHIDGDKCTIFFVDYGNFEETSVSGLMKLAEEDFLLPAGTIKCRLNNCKTSSLDLAKLFATTGQSQIDSIKVIQQEDDECVVDILDCKGKCITSIFNGSAASCAASQVQHTTSVKPALVSKMSPDIETEILPSTGELIPVTVTHIDSCSRLYVSRKDENLQAELLQLMIKLNESAESLPLLDTPWEGCVCAAQYSKDNSWYRAQVETVCNSATCIVHFIDYGNSEETSLLKLRKIDPFFTRLPGQAIRCCLLGYELSLDKATGDALKQSKSCSDGRQLEKLQSELLEKPVNVRVIKQHLDSWIVKMEDEHGECITGKFPPPGIHAISAPTISDLIFESPPEKEFDAVFTHMNNLNDFYCQRLDVEDLSELESLGHQLKEDMSKLGADIPCEPVKGGIYVSEFHDSWYRCVVEKVLGQNVLVRYIDYGNCEEKLASELRPISRERLSTPVRLFRCKLYGVSPIDPNWTGQGMGEYKEMLEQHQPHMVIQGEDEDAFLVSLYILVGNEIVNVADDLVSINIAKSTEMKKDVCPEEKRDLPASSGPSQQQRERHGEGEGEEEEDSEEVLQRKIQELQKQLEMSQKKKKSVNIKTSL